MAFNTTINTSLLTTYLIKKFIPALTAELQFQKFTTPAVIPAGSGNIGRFNVFSNPPGTTTPLVEGTTTGNQITTLTTTGTDCTIREYGEYIQETQLQNLTAVSTTRDELMNRMAYGGALAIDGLIRAQAKLTTTAWYCTTAQLGGQSAAAIPTSGGWSSIIGAARQLRGTTVDGVIVGARGFSGVEGHPNGNYAAILTPQFEATMITEGTTARTTWTQATTNAPGPMAQEKAVIGNMGGAYGTQCYRTQNYDQTTVTSLADNNYLLAQGGLGAVALKDMKPDVIINDVNSPYKNVDSIAWHIYFGTSLISSARVVRMYSYAL